MSVQKIPPQSRPRKTSIRPTARKDYARQHRRRWLVIGAGLAAVGVVSAAAGALLAFSLSATPLRQSQLSPEEEAVFQDEAISTQNLKLPSLTRPVNILFIGTKVLSSDIDRSTEKELGYDALVNSFDGLADTMLLLRFDPTKDKLAIISIPRDTKTRIKGHGITKINNANYYGGPALTAKTISDLLEGVQIDRYVRVNVQGVEKLIDALGGVEVYVPKDMKYTDQTQHLYIDLKEGEQRLDGDKAMQFLRFRYDKYGDIGRVQRQQALIRATIEQALKPSTLVRIPKILKIIQSHIDTNLSVEELVALAGFAAHTERSKVEMTIVPGDFNGTGQNGVSYWLPNRRKIREVMAQYFDRGYNEVTSTLPSALSVAIQDSTGQPEAVRSLLTMLQNAGYQNVYVDADWHEPLEMTRVIAQKGDRESAETLQTNLGFGEVRVESTGILSSDLTIQLGKDWLDREDSQSLLPNGL
ncbi:LCP family protein [Lusitaniella coriacea LEGE 07157]|uniref:LCP family protein n=1 Tax=Lusitaniella coriacea LEGE 07157 TaxID=945747 RepID=A0A8J7IWZ5_9CYAN|nr:LCP family protein [Lusitaniella coriacea]MBE9118393.1 LCP family protein [Lusitaniella coriacea LEGE 07157]